jgi:hypothetical protein
MATTSKPIVKSLPQFNPTYYLAWASDVRDAFEDRSWTSYLIAPSTTTPSTTAATDTALETTTSAFTPDPVVVNKARAFLKASIPYEYKTGLETFTTAAEIWIALEQRYASTSREDELRLKSQLMDLRKSRSDTIDQHIQKYSSLLSSVLAQQQPERRFDIPKSIAIFFGRFRILTFLAKIGRASLPSSANLGSPPPKNSYIRTQERTTIHTFNRTLRNNLPKTLRYLRYATCLKPIALAIAISASPRTIATYATIVATSIATTVPDRAQHHRATISGATITNDVLATTQTTARPNSWIRNIFVFNNKDLGNFHLTMNLPWFI